MEAVKQAHHFPLDAAIFCCNSLYCLDSPILVHSDRTRYAIVHFARAMIDANFNTRLLTPNEAAQITTPNYIIQYEKLFDATRTEPLRYFCLDPTNTTQWLELPVEALDTRPDLQTFTAQGGYVKFKCDTHAHYLFIGRVLLQPGPPKIEVPYPKRTLPRRTPDDEYDDEEYKFQEFPKPSGDSSKSWGSTTQVRTVQNGGTHHPYVETKEENDGNEDLSGEVCVDESKS